MARLAIPQSSAAKMMKGSISTKSYPCLAIGVSARIINSRFKIFTAKLFSSI